MDGESEYKKKMDRRGKRKGKAINFCTNFQVFSLSLEREKRQMSRHLVISQKTEKPRTKMSISEVSSPNVRKILRKKIKKFEMILK